ncbi:MAG TPA: aminoglycoside 6'-N-acetyltransferase [Roseiarcus sp.]|nr:aminoglycoside 6'-N-acetyltransferase [Roseiarcus sp.]
MEKCAPSDCDDWFALRAALWPEEPRDELRAQKEELIAKGESAAIFLARDRDGAVVGIAEATLRRDFVNGCTTAPVAFLEGLYVAPAWRRRGVGRRLCAAVESWGRELGCTELGSDTYLDNVGSQKMHEALGFEEMERVVCYRKII